MADDSLSISQLQQLYADFDPAARPGWAEWQARALTDTRWAQDATLETLRSPEGQERLWSLKGITTLGVGDNVRLDDVPTDPVVVEALVSLRDRHWPSQLGKRAQDIQNAFDKLLAMVGERVEGNKPKARLHRAFLALLPRQLHVGINWDSHRMIRRLVVGTRQSKQLQAAVLVRERLRQALGDETSLEDDVRRSLFLWWLFENGDALLETGQPKPDDGAAPRVPEGEGDTQSLVLLPFGKQYKGIFVMSGMLDGVCDVLQAAMGGRTRDELVELLRTEYGYSQWSPKMARAVIARLLGLGLLDREDGLYTPSEDGDRLLEDEPDILIETLFVRVYGFPQVLRAIEREPGTVANIGASVRVEYPKWTTDRMASGLLSWALVLGLCERSNQGVYSLTPLGQEWMARLPVALPMPKPGTFDTDDVETDVLPPPTNTAEHPTVGEVRTALGLPPHDHLIFSADQVRALHAAWSFHPRKRFCILSGLSGTGKTELLLTYAHIVCVHMGLDPDRHVLREAVSPDWRDPTGLLGYFNALHAEPTFQATAALRLVLRAHRNPHLPYFLILDEMNLARVERYFAPFLSAMESAKDPHIQLHAHDEPVNEVPPAVAWPTNLRIGGTVNMDETTHPFSDKVLDRAFTMEFWDVDLDALFAGRAARTDADAPVEQALLAVQAVLEPVRRHIGYRSASEVLDWVAACRSYEPDVAVATLIDQALFSKVLPRVRGAQTPALEDALRKLAGVCGDHQLPRCAAKVAAMTERLRATGVTGFWS